MTDVVLIAHCISSGLGINLGKEWFGGKYEYLMPVLTDEATSALKDEKNFYFIENIESYRKFDSLELLVCYSGTRQNPTTYLSKNLAETFRDCFPEIKKIYAYDCYCGTYPSSTGRVWAGSVDLSELYIVENDTILSSMYALAANNPTEFRTAINERYYDIVSYYYGQVLYIQNSQGFSDVFTASDDMAYLWSVYYYPNGDNNKVNIYMGSSYPTPNDDDLLFDPVLNNNL